MNFPFSNNVTLIGGGECSRKSLEEALRRAPVLIATDGAAARALAWGHMPDLVIGDMDSLDSTTKAALAPGVLHHISEQDSTDFEKALRSVTAPGFIGVGFLGARQDHTLACLNALIGQTDKICVLLGEHDICFHAPRQLHLDLPSGTRFSLFPMRAIAVQGGGLKHPVTGLVMRPGGQIGTSNAVDDTGQVRLSFEAPGMLVLIDRKARAGLDVVFEALTLSEAWKPG